MQRERVGMKAQLTDSLFVQKAGEPDPTLQTGVSLSICTCCPEMTMLSLESEGTGDSPQNSSSLPPSH